MLPNLDPVTASFHRCQFSDGFIDTFYEIFLAKSPEVADKFRDTDFVRQKLMLRGSLISMVLFNLQKPGAIEELERLGRRHSRKELNIAPHLYELWLDSLCEAVERHDPESDPDLLNSWRTAIRPGIDLIISMY